MKAISIRQPWAQAIFVSGKDIENRSWPTSVRGMIAIHAAKTADDDEYFRFILSRQLSNVNKLDRGAAARLPKGAIIGVVELIDCVTASGSFWFEGPYGFVLSNPKLISPIPLRGTVQFFDVSSDVKLQINGQLNALE